MFKVMELISIKAEIQISVCYDPKTTFFRNHIIPQAVKGMFHVNVKITTSCP